MPDTIDQLEVEENVLNEVQRNEVIVTLDGRDIPTPLNTIGLTMQSTEREVLAAVAGIIEEAEGTRDGYEDAYGNYTYTVRKAMNSNTIYVYPKPTLG